MLCNGQLEKQASKQFQRLHDSCRSSVLFGCVPVHASELGSGRQTNSSAPPAQRLQAVCENGITDTNHPGGKKNTMIITSSSLLRRIDEANLALKDRFSSKLIVNHDLKRSLVSFQANKEVNGHRWYKYKEGFSAALLQYLFKKAGINSGRILDPFAGSGTALFAGTEHGLDATGIELLPSSVEIIQVRDLINRSKKRDIATALRSFAAATTWENPGNVRKFNHLRITENAFPESTQHLLERYLWEANEHGDKVLSRVFVLAAMSVLEPISYTRKDGQYLRWDARSGRKHGKKPFNKGPILEFTTAIRSKLREIADDLTGDDLLFDFARASSRTGNLEIINGSCLEVLPRMKKASFSAIVTSPPYCNRYDYTRTYALELAMLGTAESELRDLRQTMLTCTVENKEKENLDVAFGGVHKLAQNAFDNQYLLQVILQYLDLAKAEGALNNTGIPRMVRNYFWEMSHVVAQCARLLKPTSPFIMVNDNVKYHGVQVPVDLILSSFAEHAGLDVESIWVLPRGKGNSSQQMGQHGREEIRKCVYLWRAKAK